MTLLRLAMIMLITASSLHSTAAWADVPPQDTSADGSDGGNDTGEDDEDGGCATVAAAGSIGGLGLGMALIFGLRRRED
jgi:hypothetical protein